MGFFDVFKKSRREVNRENQSQGKSGEDQTKTKWEFNGYKMERTGRGHDYKATRQDWLTGRKETKYVEVKTGTSRLSKFQKRKKRHLGGKYVVERLEPTPFGLTSPTSSIWGGSNNSIRKKSRKKKSPKSSSSFNPFGSSSTNMFGISSSSTRKKSSRRKKPDSIFGTSNSYDSLFGSSSSKRKSDDWSIW